MVKRSKTIQILNPPHLFITSGGGRGKSHLIKAIYMLLNKVMMYKNVDPEEPRILLLAPMEQQLLMEQQFMRDCK